MDIPKDQSCEEHELQPSNIKRFEMTAGLVDRISQLDFVRNCEVLRIIQDVYHNNQSFSPVARQSI
jgi:hypothetical protein